MRRNLCLYFLLFLWVGISDLFAGKVIIQGNNAEYKGVHLTLNRFSNLISSKEVQITSTNVAANGDFKLTFDVERTEYVFCHTGVFFLYLYVEPGKTYAVKLPSRIEKKQEDLMNPFFEELKVHLLVTSFDSADPKDNKTSAPELNELIRTFDEYYDPFYSKYAQNVYTKVNVSEMDTTIRKMETMFSEKKNPYFLSYYTYRMGLLKFMSSRFKSRNISDTYFLNKPVLYNNPAFMELFNEVYDKYFVYFGRTPNGKIIYKDINTERSLTKLKKTLAQNQVLANDTLKEFVILKGIHDGFYEMEFSREALLTILDSLAQTTRFPNHKTTAGEIREKVTRLLPGYAPPSFSFYNQDSVLTDLSSFKGSFVYLMFCTTQNYACLKEYDMLKKLQEKHGKILKIVTVSVDETLADTRRFAKKMKYNWTFLHYGNKPEIIRDYDIRTYPTYFLIDREGKLAMSPALSPSENFEAALFQYFRAKGVL